MSFMKYLTAKELGVALEEAVDEIESDSLTDEEAIDNKSPLTDRDIWGVDIAGTYEIHLPGNDSSDGETLAMKLMELGKSRKIHVSN
ncbi:hypothetical protein JTB14_036599 [Gonioctena quinquepunctata]|nr:hypothetical protein JTB14_036599 [Gonioctena quinquepunctata]